MTAVGKVSVLVISPHFAPASEAGAKRFSFLTAMLQGDPFDFYTVTRHPRYSRAVDESLTWGGSVIRTAMFPGYPFSSRAWVVQKLDGLWTRYLCLIDPYSGWYLPAMRQALSTIRQHDIRTIIATGPPFISMVIGYRLSQVTGARLILDYRDPWTNHPRIDIPGRLGRALNRRLEQRAIAQASAIVVCTEIMQGNFLAAFGSRTNAPVYCITNGFHAAQDVEPIELTPGKRNLCYAGKFYGERRVTCVLRPLLSLVEQGMIRRDEIRIHVFGQVKDDDRRAFLEQGVGEWLQEHAPVNHDHLLRYLRAADALLLLSGSDVSYALPFKLFDYLSVQRPIIAVAPEVSAVAQFMQKVDCGACGNMGDEDSIRSALIRVLTNKPRITFRGAERYTWNDVASQYREVIARVGLHDSERS